MNTKDLLLDFFEKDSIAKLASDAAAILDCPLMIVDETFHIIAHFTPTGFDDAVFTNAVNRGEITYEAIAMMSSNAEIQSGKPAFIELEDSPFPRRFSILKTSNILFGYLICVDTDGHIRSIDSETYGMIESVLSKQLFFEAGRQSSIFETAEEILEHLLDGNFSSEAYFKIQASSTYLADFTPKAFALIDLKSYHSLYLGSNHLKDELMYNFYASHPFLYKGDVFMFLHDGYDLKIFRRLAEEFHLKVVVSDTIDSLFQLPALYKSARESVDILIDASSESEGLVFSVSELSPLIMLHAIKDRSDLINPQIRKLAAYDNEKSGQYCETLYRYLVSGNSLKETCEALFTHRNTVLYRIRKAKEDFHIPIDSPEAHTYLLLSLSLVLYEKYGPEFFLP